MRLAVQVANLPEKPVMIYDGDCNFCTIWVRRWNQTTDDRVEYLPFQDQAVLTRFPELPRQGFETAVHLVEADGSVYSGAEAAFRALNHSREQSFMLELYQRWPVFARICEFCYRFVARHRTFFSALTRLAWGKEVSAPSHLLAQKLFLRFLGIIYLIAFVSLWAQIMGLIGSSGILPANLSMFGFRQETNAAHVGVQRYFQLPTLCWFSATDWFLKAQCAAGTFLAGLVIFGIAPAPCLFLLWLIYLSLASVSREFLSYQWDYLLLEIGFLAIFFAPLQLMPWWRRLPPPPSRLVLWLFRWLLFRLMLGSGLVKLMSGDHTWRNLTSLKYHYETQPLPTWVGWYAHQMPLRVQQTSALVLFLIELVLPVLILAPQRLRQIPCWAFIFLQVLIMLTGNYCFFNLLTIALCLLLLDDLALSKLVPRRFRTSPRETGVHLKSNSSVEVVVAARGHARPPRQWPLLATLPVACIAIFIPLTQFTVQATASRVAHWSPSLVKRYNKLVNLYNWIGPLRSFNNYGLFAVMTTNRNEIVVQGSNDGVTWTDYEFKYKPGDVKRRPGFIEPHQPRLDWQMWFAALSDYQHNFWFIEFCVRLLNGSPQVSALLRNNPFPRSPPKYVRAVVYEYHFTDFATRKRTGAWWRREIKGTYLPVISRSRQSK